MGVSKNVEESRKRYDKKCPSFAFRIKDQKLAVVVKRFINSNKMSKQDFGDYLIELFKKDRIVYDYNIKPWLKP